MKKPILVIMAAGMGSRYGGLKQIDPIDEQGHILIDYSLYDAKKAGFDQVVFVIRKEHEQIFRERVGDRAAETMKVHYAFQSLDDLPEGYRVPEGRVKPWGTGHAVLAARKYIHGPFAVINSDDYYGSSAMRLIYHALAGNAGEKTSDQSVSESGGNSSGALAAHAPASEESGRAVSTAESMVSEAGRTCRPPEMYAMVGYLLKNTLTDHGSVSRGVCTLSEGGRLASITERTQIIRKGADAAYSEDQGKTWSGISGDSVVSMNLWGFPESFIHHLKEQFPRFLDKTLKENPLKGEFFLPFAVNDLMNAGTAGVTVLTTGDVWHGVTYQQDKADVAAAMKALRRQGVYPETF